LGYLIKKVTLFSLSSLKIEHILVEISQKWGGFHQKAIGLLKKVSLMTQTKNFFDYLFVSDFVVFIFIKN